MPRCATVAMLALAAMLFASAPALADKPPDSPPFVPGSILVKLKPGATASALATAGRTIAQLGIISLPVEKGQEMATIERLKAEPNIEFAEPNYVVQAFRSPDDTLMSFYQWNLRVIRAEAAWDIQTGSDSMIVAVLDTGVDFANPDLAARLLPGINLLDSTSPPHDDNGHGSHVAGIAAAATNNGLGIAGLTWAGKVLPVKLLDSGGAGNVADLAQGLVWAADNGARILNFSGGTTGYSRALQEAVDYAHDLKGGIVVAAAGNEGGFGHFNPTFYPAAFPNVIAVTATDSNDRRADFSETGAFLDVAAPGVAIVSTVPQGQGLAALGGNYDYMTGTSMASPHVAALAALVWSANPNLTNDQVEMLIESTAVDLGSAGKDELTGYGRIDAYAAVRAAVTGILPASPRAAVLLSDLAFREVDIQLVPMANYGGTGFNWTATISPTVPWLSVAPVSGALPALSASQTLTLTARPQGITSAGTYTTSLIITGQGPMQNSPMAVPISLVIVDRLKRLYFPLIPNLAVAGW